MIEASSLIQQLETQLEAERKVAALIDRQIESLKTNRWREYLADTMEPAIVFLLKRYKDSGRPMPESQDFDRDGIVFHAVMPPELVKEVRALRGGG